VLLELFGQAFGDEMNGKAAGVCGDDCAGLAKLCDAGKELAFDFEIFGDDFNDPVGFRNAGKIVFKIANGDFVGESGSEKSGGTRFPGGFKTGTDDFVSVGRRSVGLEVGRDDIKKNARQTGIGKMGSNTSAHGARAEDDSFLDRTSHEGPF
jgi:hypothetical protein